MPSEGLCKAPRTPEQEPFVNEDQWWFSTEELERKDESQLHQYKKGKTGDMVFLKLV